MDGWMDVQMDGCTDAWMELYRWMDGCMDNVFYSPSWMDQDGL